MVLDSASVALVQGLASVALGQDPSSKKMGYPSGSAEKNLSATQAPQEAWADPWVKKIPGGGKGNPLQHLSGRRVHCWWSEHLLILASSCLSCL